MEVFLPEPDYCTRNEVVTCGCNAVKSHKGVKACGRASKCPAKAIRQKAPYPVIAGDINSV